MINEFANLLKGMSLEKRKSLLAGAEEYISNQAAFDVCIFCGKNVTDLVCDAPIGFEWTGDTAWPRGKRTLSSIKARMFTCDLPVCEGCRTTGATIFDIGGPGEHFVPDICPLHQQEPHVKGRRATKIIITEEEAEAWRRHSRMLIEVGNIRLASFFP